MPPVVLPKMGYWRFLPPLVPRLQHRLPARHRGRRGLVTGQTARANAIPGDNFSTGQRSQQTAPDFPDRPA